MGDDNAAYQPLAAAKRRKYAPKRTPQMRQPANGAVRAQTMSAAEYKAKLKLLGLTLETAPPVLGISRSTSFRYAAGASRIPYALAKLIDAMLMER